MLMIWCDDIIPCHLAMNKPDYDVDITPSFSCLFSFHWLHCYMLNFWNFEYKFSLSSGTIDPRLEPHKCLFTSTWIGLAWLPYWPPRGQQVLHQRWILGFYCTQVTKYASKVIHPGIETQGRCNQMSKTGVSVATQKGIMSSKFFLKKLPKYNNEKGRNKLSWRQH